MEYHPGIIHESLQKEFYYLINFPFAWINCNGKRWLNFTQLSDWDNFTESVNLEKGDIISIRIFKPTQTSEPYCYLEKIIRNDVEFIYQTESTISKAFLECNLWTEGIENRSWLFTDVNKIVKRDKIINNILC